MGLTSRYTTRLGVWRGTMSSYRRDFISRSVWLFSAGYV
jgi:hypothetical protein